VPLRHILKREKPQSPRNIIGARLRDIRRTARPRISQEDLCGRVASDNVTLTRTQIAKIEAGTRPVFDYEAAALAKALGVELVSIFPVSTHIRRSR
jgi:transcriptional regulator with XRE-family HTH domain